jgi:sialate O-acetylesterase
MAVTIDIGDSTDVHPRNKKDVGVRLSLIALDNLYGKSCIATGPEFDNVKYVGKKAIVSFKDNGSRLIAKDRYGYVRGFEVAGADQKFFSAKGEINGSNIILESNFVAEPVAVRYAWSNNPDGNLYNEVNLPAGPFRTDNWELPTEHIKFDRWIGNKYLFNYPVNEPLKK